MSGPVRSSQYLPLLSYRVPLEFRRHQKVDNPVYIIGFLSQWKQYLDQLPSGSDGQTFRGKSMDPTVFEKVRYPSL